MSHDPRRRAAPPVAPGLAVGITEDMIHALVHAFYDAVRRDPLLEPVFAAAVDGWEPHLDKMCAFWSSIALMTGAYKGTPMQAHAVLPDITPDHFTRWLQLFGATAMRVCPPDAAAFFIDRAERIAQSLQLGIALHRGESVAPELRAVARQR